MKKHYFIRLTSLLLAAGIAGVPNAMPVNAAPAASGDVNADSRFDSADAALLQNWLLADSDSALADWSAADFNADGKLNAADLSMMKRSLLAQSSIETPVSETYIHLKNKSVTVEGDYVEVSETVVKITHSGTFYVDGSITDGQIYVETSAEDTGDVDIVLSDVSFSNSSRQAIYTAESSGNEKTKITLLGDNSIMDTADAAYTGGAAAIYSNSKLTFTKNSTGTLTIQSYMNDGIHSEKKINLNGGSITIDTDTAPENGSITPDADGITSDKMIEIEGAVLDIDASADGIKTDAGIAVFSGNVKIKAGNDAMQAGTNIDVSGGYVVASGDRGFRVGDASAGTAGNVNITGGTVIATATDYQVNGGTETVDFSCCTQAVMLFDMAAQWKKANAITIGSSTYTAAKKYNYVLISDSAFSASESCKVYIAGQQAMHDGDASGSFSNSGMVTHYKNVDILAGGETIDSISSLMYESKLFDSSYVHTVNIDIADADWKDLTANATAQTKYAVDITIDGETLKNVSFATKGNSSLSSIAKKSNCDRYSFKVIFDKFEDDQLYYGLDKLNLNNIYSDASYMKDYISYDMFRSIGVDAPLTSYVWLSLNGEPFGLYLALEEVEEGWLTRTQNGEGELYKPESSGGGGGHGGNFSSGSKGADLLYSNDDLSSYSDIFDNAQTGADEEDMTALVAALKGLAGGTALEQYLDTDEIARYFAAHNFVLNYDSYTGTMLHNYYLFEKGGRLSMIPWDYNESFGAFAHGSSSDATTWVNYGIDTPLSGTTESARPMWRWIVSDNSYLSLYHNAMEDLISGYFESGRFESTIDSLNEMLLPYVQKDPTAFFTSSQYTAAEQTLKDFCLLRAKSIRAQLDGKLSTDTNSQNSASRIDASGINMSSMNNKK